MNDGAMFRKTLTNRAFQFYCELKKLIRLKGQQLEERKKKPPFFNDSYPSNP